MLHKFLVGILLYLVILPVSQLLSSYIEYLTNRMFNNSLKLLTLCGLTSQKTHRGGLGLSGLVHAEVHPCFPYFVNHP